MRVKAKVQTFGKIEIKRWKQNLLHLQSRFNKVCASKSAYFLRMMDFVKVYRFACAHFSKCGK